MLFNTFDIDPTQLLFFSLEQIQREFFLLSLNR